MKLTLFKSLTAAVTLISILLLQPGRGHEGPPFPLIVDQIVGPYQVSIWADPDIGIGTFYVVFMPSEEGKLPEVKSVQVSVEPVSKRIAEKLYEAHAQEVRNGARYIAEVAFDQGELWRVRIRIDGSQGGGELTAEVIATPDDGLGPFGLVVYSLPFVAVGFLWIKAAWHKKKR